MPLTDADRDRLREEETFRATLRAEAAAPPPGFLGRIAAFFETKVGFWLLTTVIAGLVASGLAALSTWIHRDQIAADQRAERSRQAFETLSRVIPTLVSDRPAERQVGLALVNSLAAENAGQQTADQVKAMLQSILAAGTAPDATPDARARAAEVARFIEAAPRVDAGPAVTSPGPPASGEPTTTAAPGGPPAPVALPSVALPSVAAPLAPAVGAVRLPPRVYIQFGSEAQRAHAQAAQRALQGAGVLAPGIEQVDVRKVPRGTELRSCNAGGGGESSQGAILDALQPVVGSVTPKTLPPSLCTNARSNHFELWIAEPA